MQPWYKKIDVVEPQVGGLVRHRQIRRRIYRIVDINLMSMRIEFLGLIGRERFAPAKRFSVTTVMFPIKWYEFVEPTELLKDIEHL